jgi:hypothetical protein
LVTVLLEITRSWSWSRRRRRRRKRRAIQSAVKGEIKRQLELHYLFEFRGTIIQEQVKGRESYAYVCRGLRCGIRGHRAIAHDYIKTV